MHREKLFDHKVDFKKAYDSIRWDFLYFMIRNLEFNEIGSTILEDA